MNNYFTFTEHMKTQFDPVYYKLNLVRPSYRHYLKHRNPLLHECK